MKTMILIAGPALGLDPLGVSYALPSAAKKLERTNLKREDVKKIVSLATLHCTFFKEKKRKEDVLKKQAIYNGRDDTLLKIAMSAQAALKSRKKFSEYVSVALRALHADRIDGSNKRLREPTVPEDTEQDNGCSTTKRARTSSYIEE